MHSTPTFEKLVWELVADQRNKLLVVDNHHVYGIIKDRVDSFWEQVRLLQPDDDQIMVLGGLVAIGAYAQLSAESLGLISEQPAGGSDARCEAAEQQAGNILQKCYDIIDMIDRNKVSTRSLQKNMPRYIFEFDGKLLDTLKQEVDDKDLR